jgi:hypothetical protein
MPNSPRSNQAHLQFTRANSRPKIAKELASPTHGVTKENKARAHNTRYKTLGFKWLIKHSATHQVRGNWTGK